VIQQLQLETRLIEFLHGPLDGIVSECEISTFPNGTIAAVIPEGTRSLVYTGDMPLDDSPFAARMQFVDYLI
jgi:hypothetical protein